MARDINPMLLFWSKYCIFEIRLPCIYNWHTGLPTTKCYTWRLRVLTVQPITLLCADRTRMFTKAELLNFCRNIFSNKIN